MNVIVMKFNFSYFIKEWKMGVAAPYI